MSAPEQHPGFPIDDPAAVVADLQGRLDALASRMVDVGRATLGRDPVVMALVDHQRHKPDRCLCGWGELGRSHAEHVAGIIRPLIEAEVRAEADGLADALDIARAERAGLREAVARELDAKALRWRTRRDATDDFGRGTYYSGLALAYDDAARIARGGYEGTGSDG